MTYDWPMIMIARYLINLINSLFYFVCLSFLSINSSISLFIFILFAYDLQNFQLGGIVKPNDGECHLNNKGEYTHSTLQDYPSVSQVSHFWKLLFVFRKIINFTHTEKKMGVVDLFLFLFFCNIEIFYLHFPCVKWCLWLFSD